MSTYSERKCWFTTCQGQKAFWVTINGTLRHVCKKHWKVFSSSKEDEA